MAWFKRKAKTEGKQENPDRLLHREEVVIPFNHLSPAMQEALRGPLRGTINRAGITFNWPPSIQFSRGLRGITETMFAPTPALLSLGIAAGDVFPTILATASLAGAANLRAGAARTIQWAHERVIKTMNHFGLLDTKFEGHYPRDWMNPGIVAKYHPIFFVDQKGNIHFLRQNKKGESFRHRWQQSKLGRVGVTGWRWRAYLRPPKFPVKEASLARRMVQGIQRQFYASALTPARQSAERRAKPLRFRRARPTTPLRRHG